jgi:DNA primase
MPFDAEKFCLDYSINSDQSRLNRGWLNIKCPFCDDKSTHLGININGAYATCFRCGGHWLPKIVSTLLKVSIPNANKIIAQYLSGEQIHEFKERNYVDQIIYPPDTGPMNNAQRQYLANRQFDPGKLEREWELKGVSKFGPYKGRILAPIRLDNELISYQTRDITGKARARYMACPDDEEVYHHQYSLYGIDKCHGQTVVVVEGITDVWRLGTGATGTFGIDYLPQQMLMIARRFNNVFIFYDNEDQAQEKADQLSFDLTKFGKKCEIITTDTGDPGDMQQDDADCLMEDLGLK